MVRYKNRYVVVVINMSGKYKHAPLSLKPFSLYNTIMKVIQQMHGDFGMAAIKSGFVIKYCNEITKIALIKVRHGPHRIFTSTIPFIDKLEGKDIFLNTLYIGATMKQCFKFILIHQKKYLNEIWATLSTESEKLSFEQAIMNLNAADNIEMK